MKSKKGLALEFLVALIFAIILFVPSIIFSCQLFGGTNQASQNFNEFVVEIKDFAEKSGNGEKGNFMLIMDEKSVIYGFNKNSLKIEESYSPDVKIGISRNNVPLTYRSSSMDAGTFTSYFILYPESQCKSESCLCLCPEEEFIPINPDDFNRASTYRVECSSLSCINIGDIGLEGPNHRNIRFSRLNKGDGISENRRNLIYFMNKDEQIIISPNVIENE
jgi:hypothetical protein